MDNFMNGITSDMMNASNESSQAGGMPIALCADDYAQNPQIDAGILSLLAAQRLSAVGCFSESPHWREQAGPALREQAAAVDVGLHFNLTHGFAEPAPYALRSLILRSLFTRLDAKWLHQRLHAQLDAFEAGYGSAPAFIDGHQHVHQFPGVRQVLLKVLEDRYGDRPVWVRNTVPASPRWRGKPQLLKLLGGAMTATALRAMGIHSNHGFAGVYGFDRPDYAACFAEWLQAATPGMLIMCHPAAAVADGGDDSIAAQRVIEYRFLASPQFLAMLHDAGVVLAPLSQMDLAY
jgi:predicted glycoside hydrolase/deacetylase ChbG (UPF0249 family)